MIARALCRGLIFLVLFTSCHKDSTPPSSPSGPGTTSPTLGTMNINLTYPRGALNVASFELIMTIVDTLGGTHAVTLYKSINPSDWINVFPGSYVTRHLEAPSNRTSATIELTNFPAVAEAGTNIFSSFLFNNGPIGSEAGEQFSPYSNTMEINYQRYAGVYNYIAIPE